MLSRGILHVPGIVFSTSDSDIDDIMRHMCNGWC